MAENQGKPAPQEVDFSSLMTTCRLSANAYTANRRDPASDVSNPSGDSALNKLEQEATTRLQASGGGKPGTLAIAEVVDVLVNERVRYSNEPLDNWQTGAHTAARGRGDCDDFAILKSEMLVRLGVPADRVGVLILGAKDGSSSGHAVCTVTGDDGQVYVLNNEQPGKNRLMGIQKLDDYLRSDISEGGRMVPIGTMRVDTGKIEWNDKLRDGKLSAADMAVKPPPVALPTLAEMNESQEFRNFACTLVAREMGGGATPDQMQYMLRTDPQAFAATLKDALKDPAKLPPGLKPEAVTVLQHYADELNKTPAAKPADPAVEKNASALYDQLMAKPTIGSQSTQASVSVAAPEKVSVVTPVIKQAAMEA